MLALHANAQDMSEGGPIPIFRGVETREATNEKIREAALQKYKELTVLHADVESRIQSAMADQADPSASERLASFFEQKHAVDQISDELEEIIMRSFDRADDLRERWLSLQARWSDDQRKT